MKSKKAVRLAREIIEQDRMLKTPLTFRSLTICWSKRTVDIDGKVIDMSDNEVDCLTIPLLSTEQPVISKREWYG